jgi:hypothetical protein
MMMMMIAKMTMTMTMTMMMMLMMIAKTTTTTRMTIMVMTIIAMMIMITMMIMMTTMEMRMRMFINVCDRSQGKIIGGPAGLAIPLIIFGVTSVVAGSLLFLLPETQGRRLPETIQDAIELHRKPNVKVTAKDEK